MASEEQPENVFEVELDGQPDWGIKLSSNLIVLASARGRALRGQVNETPVKKLQEFEAIALQTAQMRVEVTRGLKSASRPPAPSSSCQLPFRLQNDVQLLPPEREKNVTRRDGFSYRLTQIDFQKGCKFGLGIKHYQNRVLVSRVDEGEFPLDRSLTTALQAPSPPARCSWATGSWT
ncbi:PDZ domain-containing protein [Aphelenchoides fujianensis]|nr:PDZ domain-containing protein [Aphelenchoides fujianensis]